MKLITYQTPYGVFGELLCENGKKLCDTVEPHYRDNEPFISCVPSGTYELIEYDSPTYGKTYALENPEKGIFAEKDKFADRWAILIHPANHSSELQGCIAPGKAGMAQSKDNTWEWGVTHSRKHFKELMDYLEQSGDRILTIHSQGEIR